MVDDDEAWVYLPHASRRALQQQKNASLSAFVEKLGAVISDRDRLDRERAEQKLEIEHLLPDVWPVSMNTEEWAEHVARHGHIILQTIDGVTHRVIEPDEFYKLPSS